jgi:hypothetical protein
MKNLQRYLDEKINFWAKFQNKTLMTLPLSTEDIEVVTDSLACNLSPENLHCDGEITRAQAQTKYNFYMRVHRDLERATGTDIDIHMMY